MPSETDLPAVVPSRSPVPAEGDVRGAGPDAEGEGGAPARSGGAPRGLEAVGAAAVGLLLVLVALGVARLLGEGFREALLVEVETSPMGSEPTYSDAPREAARFFADRDSVTVTVPRDMTVADFLALYHLENNPGARAALRDQLGAAAPGDPLREGDQVTVPLTLRRGGVTREGGGATDAPIPRDPGTTDGGPAAPGGTP